MKNIMKAIKTLPKKHLIQLNLAIIFILPLIATIGQFSTSQFMLLNHPFSVLFWPGEKDLLTLNLPVYLTFGIMSLSFVFGIIYLIRKKTFGTVIILGFTGILFSQFMGGLLNSLTGWRELQEVSTMNLDGRMNALIYALWHDPVWEEIVFRGIPYVLLMPLIRKHGTPRRIAIFLYLLAPSIAMTLYHIPNHGYSRIWDTMLLSIFFALLTLRYSFFAPLILHYIFDTVMIINLGKMEGIPTDEIKWLVCAHPLLNSLFTVFVFTLPLLLIVLLMINAIKQRKNSLTGFQS